MSTIDGSLGHNSTLVPPVAAPPGLISDVMAAVVTDLILNVIIQFALRVFCVVSNIVNIVVFVRIGLEDGITVAFFALSIADMMFVGIYFVVRILSMFHRVLGLRPYVRLTSLAFLIAWYSNAFFDVSILITVFLAVQKCACVAIPLLFKNVFTRFRSTVVIVVIYLGAFTWYTPWYATQGLIERFNSRTNTTHLVFRPSPHFTILFQLFQSVSRTVFPWTALSLVVLCVIILSFKLKQATRFRQTVTVASQNTAEGDKKKTGSTSKKGNSNSREIRVIKSVTLVSAIFVVCYIPDIIGSFLKFAYPEFSENGRYRNTYRLVDELHNIMTVLNSSVNIFVYYSFNTRYREKLMGVFIFLRHRGQSSKKTLN